MRRENIQKQNYLKAKKSLQKLEEEIALFIKPKKFKVYKNMEQWQETSTVYNYK